jgi:hypothetical protein
VVTGMFIMGFSVEDAMLLGRRFVLGQFGAEYVANGDAGEGRRATGCCKGGNLGEVQHPSSASVTAMLCGLLGRVEFIPFQGTTLGETISEGMALPFIGVVATLWGRLTMLGGVFPAHGGIPLTALNGGPFVLLIKPVGVEAMLLGLLMGG